MQRAHRGPGSHWQCTPQLPLFSMCSNSPFQWPAQHTCRKQGISTRKSLREWRTNQSPLHSALSTSDGKKMPLASPPSSFHTGNYVSFPVFYILNAFHLFSKRVFSILLPILHIKKFKVLSMLPTVTLHLKQISSKEHSFLMSVLHQSIGI